MDPKNLILLDEDEAKIVLKKAMEGELDVYIIDTHRKTPFLLNLGDLERIRRCNPPHRIEIILESSSPRTSIPRFERVGSLDLRITKAQYQETFKEEVIGSQINQDNIDLLQSEYYRRLTSLARKAIDEYLEWKKHSPSKKIMITKHIEPLLKNITTVQREIKFLKKILSDFFEELR